MRNNKNSGFTLIELLVVISIIGVLSSIVLTSVNAARSKARDSKRILEVKQIKTAMELSYNQNRTYPLPSGGTTETVYNLLSLQSQLAAFAPRLPTDPSGTTFHQYQYIKGATDQSYGLLIRLEKNGYCITGQNVNPSWWGAYDPYPLCVF